MEYIAFDYHLKTSGRLIYSCTTGIGPMPRVDYYHTALRIHVDSDMSVRPRVGKTVPLLHRSIYATRTYLRSVRRSVCVKTEDLSFSLACRLYTEWAKKLHTAFIAITSSAVNKFS